MESEWREECYILHNLNDCIKENAMKANLVLTICFGLALAMGVAVFVLGIVTPLAPATGVSLLAVGVIALAIAGLQKQ